VARFKWKQLILVFSVITIILGFVGAFYYNSQRQLFQKGREDELTVIADLKVEQIVKWRQSQAEIMRDISGDAILGLEVQEILEGTKSPESLAIPWMNRINGIHSFEGVCLMNRAGKYGSPAITERHGLRTPCGKQPRQPSKVSRCIFQTCSAILRRPIKTSQSGSCWPPHVFRTA
jgi:hypothetical protein